MSEKTIAVEGKETGAVTTTVTVTTKDTVTKSKVTKRTVTTNNAKSKWMSVFLAFRPKTLTAALVPCLAATALVKAMGLIFSLPLLVFALLSSFCIQIGTNFVNDAMDFKKGADTEQRIGPQRITASGVLSPKAVLAIGSLFFLAAVLLGVPLVFVGGIPIVVLGILSVAMGYAYTSGPFPLAYVGLGDLFVILFFGLAAVMGMTFIHSGYFGEESLILGLQIGFHATTLIAVNNFRDMKTDAVANKRTLAVRFGSAFMRKEIFFLSFAPYLLNIYWLSKGFSLAAILPLLSLPLAIHLVRKIQTTEPGPIFNSFLGKAAGLHLTFGLLISIGFWLK